MINKVIVSGNITKDIELRKTQKGTSVVSFYVACNERTKEGTETTFVPVTAWSKTAEFIPQWFHKGDGIEIVGKLHGKERDVDGTKVNVIEIWAESVSFPSGGNKTSAKESNPAEEEKATESEFEPIDDTSGDLPF